MKSICKKNAVKLLLLLGIYKKMILKVTYSASAFSLRHSNNWSLNFQSEKKSAGTPDTVEIKDKLKI